LKEKKHTFSFSFNY